MRVMSAYVVRRPALPNKTCALRSPEDQTITSACTVIPWLHARNHACLAVSVISKLQSHASGPMVRWRRRHAFAACHCHLYHGQARLVAYTDRHTQHTLPSLRAGLSSFVCSSPCLKHHIYVFSRHFPSPPRHRRGNSACAAPKAFQ